MAAKISVLGLILSSYPYLRSAMVRFSLSLNGLNKVNSFLKFVGKNIYSISLGPVLFANFFIVCTFHFISRSGPV